MISYSCSDYTFPLLPAARRFELLHLLGFSHADVGLFERSEGLRPSELRADPKGFTKRLKTDLRRAGLQVADLFLQTAEDPPVAAVNHPNTTIRAKNRKAFQQALELCAVLDCRHMTGLPGVRHKGVKPADDLARAKEEASWRVETARAAGITYAIEAHIGAICSTVKAADSFARSVPGLTLTLDYGHFVWAGASSSEIHPLTAFASHIHARGAARKRLQTPVSENTIDFAGMMRQLAKQNYRGFVALEYVWTEWGQCNRTDNVTETLLLRNLLDKAQAGRGK